MDPENVTSVEVTTDSLEASLNDLLKAADAGEVLSKASAGAISASGTQGSEGAQGGGMNADPGRVESLMIGKLIDSGLVDPMPSMMGAMNIDGLDVSQFGDGRFAGYLTGFMHGKAGQQMDTGDGSNEDYMDGYRKGYLHGHGASSGGTQKSQQAPDFVKSLQSDSEISEALAIDGTGFLRSIVTHVGTALNGFSKSRQTLDRSHALALYQIGTLVKSQQAVIKELGQRLGIVERTPLPRKGVTNDAQAKALKKSFEGGEESKPLTKSQVTNVLSYMRLQKGLPTVAGRQISDAVAYTESTGEVQPDTLSAIQAFLASNPTEASAALSFR
jgi:hypothetical protein